MHIFVFPSLLLSSNIAWLLCKDVQKKRTAQLDDELVKYTSYTDGSVNTTRPVCHRDPNKRNAVVVLKQFALNFATAVLCSTIIHSNSFISFQ